MTDGKQPSKQQIADDMKAKANQTSREMKDKGREELEKQESRAADTVDKVADATRAAADELERENETTLSHYVSEIAEGIGGLSSNLRSKNTDDLIRDASRLARENAGLFLLGSVAVGFGLARIAKANRPAGYDAEGSWEDYYGQQRKRSYGADAESAVSTGSTAQPSTGATSVGRTATGARDTGSTAAPGGTGTTGSTGTSNPTHASTSYLPEDGSSAQSPLNSPKSDTRTSPNNPGSSSSS